MISAKEAKKIIDTTADAIIVDVRTPSEYREGHLPNALSLPLNTLPWRATEMLPDKNALLLVHCQSGMRSQVAAQQLTAMGYKRVMDFGGIMNWPYEVVRG